MALTAKFRNVNAETCFLKEAAGDYAPTFNRQEHSLSEKHRILSKRHYGISNRVTGDCLAGEVNSDVLTFLSSRKLFQERAGRLLLRTKRDKNYLFAVLFLDLDRFKVVNEAMGHEAGDQLLIEVGQRIEGCIRAVDSVVRFGGDKYIILLDDIRNPSDAVRVTERIQKTLDIPIRLNGNDIFAGACIGIALSSHGYSSAEELLRDAEIAMYRAKRRGARRYEIFDIPMHEDVVKLLQLESDLRRALDRGELRLHYQPIVSLKTRRIAAFEALVRWQHPVRGLLYPSDFLPLAEETGLIVTISQWGLQESCQQLSRWREEYPGVRLATVSVNITSEFLARPTLVQDVLRLVSENGLDPGNLGIEITENQIMADPGSMSKVLTDLREEGIKISIDDFGTGYSSLSYLMDFPIHSLKVDRSFVRKLADNGKNLSIVRSIISLGRNLDLEVVAEGVETEEQADYLRALECSYAQGYYFARPTEGELAGWFIKRLGA